MESENSVKEFRGIIHDLTNHITTLTLSMNQLERQCFEDSAKLREYAKRSACTRKNIKNFVDSIRKHIRGKDICCYFSPDKKISEIIELFTFRATKSKVSMFTHIKNNARGVRLYGSRIRFVQVFTNIISNAIDAFDGLNDTSQNEVYILISKIKDFIQISIENNGPEIPHEIKAKIFDPFFTTKNPSGGTGLGLSVAKEIIENNFRGKIYLDKSSKTKFVLTFPLT